MESSRSMDKEERVYRPVPQVILDATLTPREMEAAQERAKEDPLEFWEEAALGLDWFRKWDQVFDERSAPFYRWFVGGKCNIVHNALDRHVETANKNKLALIWEGEPGDRKKLTYYELFREVNRFANALRSLGIGRGDRVVIYMPQLPETVVAMLASAKIGAVHNMVFPGLSAKALRDRVNQVEAKLIVTADGFYRNGRVHNLKNVVDEAMMGPECDSVESMVVVHRVNVDVEMNEPRDLWYEDLVRQESPVSPTEIMDAEDDLFILQSSGTSGKPKGIVHCHGGYMVGVSRTFNWIFDSKPTDIFWCTASMGWITGHSYVVYAPLIAGTTVVLYEGHPLYPQADRVWSIVEKYGVTTLYTTPTLIRMLMRFGNQYPKKNDLSTLRLLATVGEPIHPDAWTWFYTHIGRSKCPVLDTWWQTETGAILVSPMPISPLKPGSVGKPFPGIEADIVDENGKSLPAGESGFLVIRKPWPSMMRRLYNDEAAYRKNYWDPVPGAFFTGDLASRDEDGYFTILGRSDDVLIIAGHRIGNAEVETALTSHRAVSEAAVVAVADRIKGQVAKAFVVLDPAYADVDDPASLVKELKEHVRREMGPVAVVRSIEIVEGLPRTKSGKILRHALRDWDPSKGGFSRSQDDV